MANFRAGKRADAAALCNHILAATPVHAGANHLLGVIHLLGGDSVTAESLIRTSLNAASNVQAEADLSLALKSQRRYPEAEAALRRALSLDPQFAFAHHSLARLFQEQGKLNEAHKEFLLALELNPGSAEYRFNFGKLLAAAGRAPEAVEQFQHAAALRPDWAEAPNSLGASLAELNRREEAESAFLRALNLNPNFPEALANLGMLLIETERFDEAEAALRVALSFDPKFLGASEALANLMHRLDRPNDAIDVIRQMSDQAPDNPGVLSSLGAKLAEERRFSEAEPVLRRALALVPDSPIVLTNLGNLLIETHRPDEGEVHLRRALDIDPKYWGATYNLAVLLKNARRLDEAELYSRMIVEQEPNLAAGHVGLGNVLLSKNSGDITEALNHYRRALELEPGLQIAHSNLTYMLTFVSEDGHAVLEEGRRFAAQFETPFASQVVQYDNERTSGRRLRVGYVSPDFRNHCQALFMLPLLSNHDHDAIEVYCYSSVSNPDQHTQKLSQYADVWRDVHQLSDEALADQIKADKIDVLVDLTMHMCAARPLLFARRPAPVQIAWLAYPGTTGLSSIGYRFTDPWLDPLGDPEADKRYSEQSIRLPDTFWCYAPLEASEVNALPADATGHITFGCLNNPGKLTDFTFDLWAHVMQKVAGSRLRLLVAQGETRECVSAKFEARGIDRERLIFADYQPREQYLRAYHDIDIVLDTFPYNGHTTSLDAMYMGVPVVTIIGETPASRAGYSLLTNMGKPELIARNASEFVDIASALASDLPRLRTLRAHLRSDMEASPLMNGARFARGIEAGFQYAWNDWLQTQI